MDVKQVATQSLTDWYHEEYAKLGVQYEERIEDVYKQVLENVVECVDEVGKPKELGGWTFRHSRDRSACDLRLCYAFVAIDKINKAIDESGKKVVVHQADFRDYDGCVSYWYRASLFSQWTDAETEASLTPDDIADLQGCCSSCDDSDVTRITQLN